MMGLKVLDAGSTVGYDVWEVGKVQIMESYVLLYVALTLLYGWWGHSERFWVEEILGLHFGKSLEWQHGISITVERVIGGSDFKVAVAIDKVREKA